MTTFVLLLFAFYRLEVGSEEEETKARKSGKFSHSLRLLSEVWFRFALLFIYWKIVWAFSQREDGEGVSEDWGKRFQFHLHFCFVAFLLFSGFTLWERKPLSAFEHAKLFLVFFVFSTKSNANCLIIHRTNPLRRSLWKSNTAMNERREMVDDDSMMNFWVMWEARATQLLMARLCLFSASIIHAELLVVSKQNDEVLD